MLKVGITGGIGSGKTTVCKLFEQLGIPVYYADDRAKYLMQHEHHLIDELKKNFGEEVFKDGLLNRAYLSAQVFNNPAKLAVLNSLVHPAVYRDTERWVEEQSQKNVPYILKEAALLVETGSYKQLDKLIVVTASLNTRVKRVVERDHVSPDDVMARIKNQLPDEEKIKVADYVLVNDGSKEELQENISRIHTQLVELWQRKNTHG